MQQEYIAQGNTVDEAIQAGCEKLGLDSFDVTTEILELPKKGFFGKIKSPAKVKITYDDGIEEVKKPAQKKSQPKQGGNRNTAAKKEASKPEGARAKSRPSDGAKENAAVGSAEKPAFNRESKQPTEPGDIDKKLEIAQEYLRNVVTAMGVDEFDMEVEKTDEGAVIALKGDNLGVVIGRRGETLDSLQYLVSLAANRIDSGYYRIAVDCGDFRSKRRQTLIELADKIADSVIKTGRSTTLEPMNPYERRIIHAVISEKDGVVSRSVGDEPYRKVVVSVPGARPYRRSPRSGDSGYRRGGGGSRGGRGSNDRRPRREQPYQPAKPDENREKLDDASGGSLYSKIEF